MHLVAYPTLFYSPYYQDTDVVTIQHESPMFKFFSYYLLCEQFFSSIK